VGLQLSPLDAAKVGSGFRGMVGVIAEEMPQDNIGIQDG
jgi:hypothetical protein